MAKVRRPRARRVADVGISVVRGPHKSNARCWYWRARRKGDSRDIWTGWATPEDAEAEVLAVIARGGREDQEVDDAVVDVEDLIEVWHGEGVEPRTDITTARKRSLADHGKIIVRLLGQVLLERFDQGHLEKLRDGMGREGYATGTQIVVCGSLLAAWGWGQDRGYCDLRKLSLPSINHKPTPKPEIEWADFWAAVDALSRERPPEAGETAPRPPLPRWVALALTIIGLSGARVGEVSASLLEDYELDGPEPGVWFGRHEGASKTGERFVHLPPEAVDEIKAFVEAGEAGAVRLLPVTFETGRNGLRKALRELVWKKGRRFTPRDIRCLVTDTYYDEGKDPTVEAKQLGHSVTTARQSYRRLRSRHVVAQVATITGWRRPGSPEAEVSDIEAARRRREAGAGEG